MKKGSKPNRGRRGQAAVEIALMSPWIFLLFIAIFDFGFYAYAAISTANAARAAALVTSTSPGSATDPSSTACEIVKREMSSLPNNASFGACPLSASSGPLKVTAASGTGPDGAASTVVSVTYETVQLFPLPWITGKMSITRIAEMRVRNP